MLSKLQFSCPIFPAFPATERSQPIDRPFSSSSSTSNAASSASVLLRPPPPPSSVCRSIHRRRWPTNERTDPPPSFLLPPSLSLFPSFPRLGRALSHRQTDVRCRIQWRSRRCHSTYPWSAQPTPHPSLSLHQTAILLLLPARFIRPFLPSFLPSLPSSFHSPPRSCLLLLLTSVAVGRPFSLSLSLSFHFLRRKSAARCAASRRHYRVRLWGELLHLLPPLPRVAVSSHSSILPTAASEREREREKSSMRPFCDTLHCRRSVASPRSVLPSSPIVL